MLYQLTGIVGSGKKLGRTVGMPTINLETKDSVDKIPSGVYASVATVRGKKYIGITNVGPRPTVDSDCRITIETYLLDFSEDVYGEEVILELHQFIRPIQKFDSLDEVKAQVQKDISQINISL